MHIMSLPVFINVLKQFLPRKVLAALHNFCQPRITNVDIVPLSGFSSKMKTQRFPAHVHMFIAHRRQPKGIILPSVFVVSYSNQAHLQQPNHRRQNFVPRQTFQSQVSLDSLPKFRQRPGKRNHPAIFRFITDFSPALVITTLFASPCVASRRL